MALSFNEKRAATSAININVKLIAGGSLTFNQKRESTKIINANVALLGGEVTAITEALFQQITKGVHDALGAMGIFAKIKAEVDRLTRETIGGDSALDKQLLAACIKCADLAESEGVT